MNKFNIMIIFLQNFLLLKIKTKAEILAKIFTMNTITEH